MKILKLELSGMSCEGCAKVVRDILEHPAIQEKEITYATSGGQIRFDDTEIKGEEILDLIRKTPYQIEHYTVESGVKTEDTVYDLLILGGGSAAFSAAIRANTLQKRTLIIQGGLPLGGTCVNVGCVPSKFLLRAAEQVHLAGQSRFAGIQLQGKPKVDFNLLVKEKRELVAQLRKQKYSDILEGLEYVRMVEGMGYLTGERTIRVGEVEYKGEQILIATGSRTKIPNVEGLSKSGYLTATTLFDLEELPESIAVLGGGYIALELAQMMSRLGASVSILQRSNRILSKEHPDVSEEIQRQLEEEGITFQLGVVLKRVSRTKNRVLIEFDQGDNSKSIEATHIVVATGTVPNTHQIGLEDIGVKMTSNGHIQTDAYLRSSIDGIWACGDVIETPAYVYVAAYEGALAVDNMYGDEGGEVCCSAALKKADYRAMPWVVFTDPQVAGVGMDELQAEAVGMEYEVSVLPMTYVPRCIVSKDTRGWIKLLRNKQTKEIIGARIVAPEGSELTMEISLAIRHGVKSEEIAEAFHAYLTMSEAVKLAAIGFGKSIEQLSCCAS